MIYVEREFLKYSLSLSTCIWKSENKCLILRKQQTTLVISALHKHSYHRHHTEYPCISKTLENTHRYITRRPCTR